MQGGLAAEADRIVLSGLRINLRKHKIRKNENKLILRNYLFRANNSKAKGVYIGRDIALKVSGVCMK